MSNASDFFTDGGNSNLINGRIKMDQAEVNTVTLIDVTTLRSSQDTQFWDRLTNTENEMYGARGDWISMALDTTEQTIIDETSVQGVLTHVIGPGQTANGDITTIRITVDGKEYEYIMGARRSTSATASRAILGYFPNWSKATSGSNTDVGHLSAQDNNYSINAGDAPQVGLTIPRQAMELGYGIPFENSIKVTVQLSAAPTAASLANRTGVMLSNYLYKQIK